jgi:hypothetical protein
MRPAALSLFLGFSRSATQSSRQDSCAVRLQLHGVRQTGGLFSSSSLLVPMHIQHFGPNVEARDGAAGRVDECCDSGEEPSLAWMEVGEGGSTKTASEPSELMMCAGMRNGRKMTEAVARLRRDDGLNDNPVASANSAPHSAAWLVTSDG